MDHFPSGVLVYFPSGVPSDRLRTELEHAFKNADTLADRHTLMLYWLLRHRRSRDFSYKNIAESKPLRQQAGRERPLAADVEPERQHIVPYSLLESVYRIDKRGRLSRHPANNIGNITWISREENHWETGLGSKMIDLEHEDGRNLEAHCLGQTLADAYRNVQSRLKQDGKPYTETQRQAAERAFEKFTAARRGAIAAAMTEWVEELSAKRLGARIEPEPLFEKTLQDRIRDQDYGDELEDELLALLRHPLVRVGEWRRDGVFFCRLRPASATITVRLHFFPDRIEVRGDVTGEFFQALVALSQFEPEASPLPEGGVVLPATCAAGVFTRFREGLGAAV